MKKYIYSLLVPLIFASVCYAHDPSAMILLFAQYGAIATLIFVAPVPVVTFCSVKLITTYFKHKNKIATLVLHWMFPAILSFATAIIFPIAWISKYGINSILEFYEVTLYFWFGVVAIATIGLCLLVINWNTRKTLIRNKLVQYIRKCYYGEEKLVVVFWIWNIAVFNGLSYVLLCVSVFTVFIFDHLNLSISNVFKLDFIKLLLLSLFIAVIVLICLMFVVYTFWMFLSLVRSYKNVNKQIWLYPAGAIVLAEACYYGMIMTMFIKEFISG